MIKGNDLNSVECLTKDIENDLNNEERLPEPRPKEASIIYP